MDNLGRDMMLMFYIYCGAALLAGCAIGAGVVWLVQRLRGA